MVKQRIEPDMQSLADFALDHLRHLPIDAAELACSEESGLSATIRSQDIESLTHHLEKNFSVTVYYNQQTGSASSVDFSQAAIKQTIEKALAIARHTQPDGCAGLPKSHELAMSYPDCDLYHPWNISSDDAITMALNCERVACDNARIKQSEGVTVGTFVSDVLYANTLDFTGRYRVSEHALSCGLLAEKDQQMQRGHAYTVARNAQDLQSFDIVAKEACDRTIKRLGAKRLKTQHCPVIFEAPVAKSLLRAFVSAISGGNLYRDASFLKGSLEKVIFPSWLSIHQAPHLLGAMGSAPFDQEGVLTKKQYYIKNGVLTSYALSTYSAKKLNLTSTGNSGGVFNLSSTHTDPSLTALLQKMGRGVLVTELMGQGVNITTGDYSRGASGYWVENGQIQYPVEEFTIAGNLKTMFHQITGIANDVDIRSSVRSGSILLENMSIAGN